MTLSSSQNPKDFTFKAFENKEKDTEMPYNITRDELTPMAKRIINKKRSWNSIKAFTKIKNLEKERDLMNNHPKKRIKVPLKVRSWMF